MFSLWVLWIAPPYCTFFWMNHASCSEVQSSDIDHALIIDRGDGDSSRGEKTVLSKKTDTEPHHLLSVTGSTNGTCSCLGYNSLLTNLKHMFLNSVHFRRFWENVLDLHLVWQRSALCLWQFLFQVHCSRTD